MYVIGVLCMLKLYYSRHTDAGPTSKFIYFLLAIMVLLTASHTLQRMPYFVGLFTVCYIIFCILLSINVYYYGQVNVWHLSKFFSQKLCSHIVPFTFLFTHSYDGSLSSPEQFNGLETVML